MSFRDLDIEMRFSSLLHNSRSRFEILCLLQGHFHVRFPFETHFFLLHNFRMRLHAFFLSRDEMSLRDCMLLGGSRRFQQHPGFIMWAYTFRMHQCVGTVAYLATKNLPAEDAYGPPTMTVEQAKLFLMNAASTKTSDTIMNETQMRSILARVRPYTNIIPGLGIISCYCVLHATTTRDFVCFS